MFEESETDGHECPICLVEHDDEIHAATLSVKRWWRWQVTRYLYEEHEQVNDNPAAA
jgi:hypothetical protein